MIAQVIGKLLESHRDELLKGRYPAAHNLRREVGNHLKWADGREVTQRWDAAVLELLGPKESEANQAVYAANKSNAADNKKKAAAVEKEKEKQKGSQLEEGELGLVAGMDRFGTPQDNKQLDPRLLEEHLK